MAFMNGTGGQAICPERWKRQYKIKISKRILIGTKATAD